MPAYRPRAVACALALAGLLCGCLAPRSDRPALTPDGAGGVDAALGEALANFGAGILREGLREDGALDNFARAAELAPEHVRISFHLAMQYAARGEADRAVAVMEAACARAPDSPEAALLLAHLAQALKKPDLARRCLRHAINLAPQQSAYHLQLAMFYAAQQDEEAALAALEAALPMVDDPLPLLRILGDLHAARFQALAGESAPAASGPRRDAALNRAIECYARAGALRRDELWTDYQDKLGDLLVLAGRSGEAAVVFEALLKERPTDPAPRKKLALCQIAAGRRQEALAQLRQILENDQGNAEIQCLLGDLQADAGDVPSAIAAYDAAIKAAPDNAAACVKLAMLLAPSDLDQAIAVLLEGRNRLPRDLAIQDLLARLLLRAERGAEALPIFEALQKALERDMPEALSAAFWMGYAEAARQSGRPGLAARFYEKAMALAPGQPDAYVNLALLLIAGDDGARAAAVMQRARDAMPDNADAQYLAGMIFNQAGAFDQACAAFQRVGELAESDPRARGRLNTEYFYYYGVACEREKQYARAEELLLRAMELNPDHAEAFNYLAYMWADQGINLTRALLFIRHALDFDPENGAYLDTLGWIYFKLGRLADAEMELLNALAVIEDDPVIMEHYGDVLDAAGRGAEAVEWWLKSRRRNPGNPGLDAKLRARGVDLEGLAPGDDFPAATPDETKPTGE